jgi:hypothetical protein
MLDDLRNSASESFPEEEENITQQHEVIRLRPRPPSEPFLGMTAQQRFVVALMLFLMVSVLGALFLVATESVYLAL